MYSESNRRSAARRTDDDFLRRMLGGQLTGDALPVISPVPPQARPIVPTRDEPVKTTCDGSTQNDQTGMGCRPQSGGNACPTCISAPSIAMVYAPRQCWRNLLDPASGLSHGSIFAELILPLEAVPQKGEKEVKTRRPM